MYQRVVTGIQKDRTPLLGDQFAECNARTTCPIERMQSMAENPSLRGIRRFWACLVALQADVAAFAPEDVLERDVLFGIVHYTAPFPSNTSAYEL